MFFKTIRLSGKEGQWSLRDGKQIRRALCMTYSFPWKFLVLDSETQLIPTVEETELRFWEDWGNLSSQYRALVRRELPRDRLWGPANGFPEVFSWISISICTWGNSTRPGKELPGKSAGKVPVPTSQAEEPYD